MKPSFNTLLATFKSFCFIIVSLWLLMPLELFSQSDSNIHVANDKLLDDYILSRGYSSSIVFDSSNIKQYWIDNSVYAAPDHFFIQLRQNSKQLFESLPYKIQLSNVIENMLCRVEVFTESSDLFFSVLGKNKTVLSRSADDQFFLQYHIFSSTFPLEDTDRFSFFIQFQSANLDLINVKKIVLSFSENKKSSFGGSPGFNQLLDDINKKGISVSNSEVKFLVSLKDSKIFIMIPNKFVSYRFSYHIFPQNSSDLSEGRQQYGFNNNDFSFNEKQEIPKPYLCNSEYTILYQNLPQYPFSSFKIGQMINDNGTWKGIWTANVPYDTIKDN